MDRNLSPAPSSDQKITIVCPSGEFGDFITGLLGKPQVVEHSLKGDFVVTREDLLGLHYLVEQRISEQNEAQLIQFVARVGFDDGLSVEISSLDEFKDYAEVRSLVTHYASITWVYLVKFRGRSTPERQQIDVAFSTKPDIPILLDSEAGVRILSGSRFFRMGTGVVIRVSYTMRSWGMDLENLLSEHLKVFLGEKKGTIPRLMKRFSNALGFVLFSASMSIFLLLGVLYIRFATRDYNVPDLPPNAPINLLLSAEGKKIDLLYSFIGGGHGATIVAVAVLYFALTAIASIFMCAKFSEYPERPYPSFILFTARDEKNKVAQIKKFTRSWQRAVVGFGVTVIGGVASDVIFSLFW